jgi:hypothetical protein
MGLSQNRWMRDSLRAVWIAMSWVLYPRTLLVSIFLIAAPIAMQVLGQDESGGGAGGGAALRPRGADGGTEEQSYPIRDYTGYLQQHPAPEQAIVDWILRDTGTDAWFTAPYGHLWASRDELRVKHTPAMQQVVKEVVDRFVLGPTEKQNLSLRLITVGNPNWRSNAHALMRHVNVQSPGVQAWLVSKENVAVLLSMLRKRMDFREVQSVELPIHNGQKELVGSMRGRNYVRAYRQSAQGWPPYEPETGEVQEGYQMELSPLLTLDRQALDLVIRCNIDQVEELVPVDLDLPLPTGQMHRARVEVPQVVSWRLHERFRWPVDQVLVLSCGVIAAPQRPDGAAPLISVERLLGNTPGRADALLLVEFRGRATEAQLTTPPQVATGPVTVSRGRY